MHKKDLVKQRYKSIDTCSGPTRLRNKGERLKQMGRVKSYRVVPMGRRWELYVK